MFTLSELFDQAYEVGQILAWYSLGYLGSVSLLNYDFEIVDALKVLAPVIYAQDLSPTDYETFIPLPEWYQVWIGTEFQSESDIIFAVVLFDSISFLEGFRQACNEAQVDFRSLIWGLPMRREGDSIVYYTWRGYDFKQPSTSTSPIARESWYQSENYENHRERIGSEEEPV
jgi:hypothetical protein